MRESRIPLLLLLLLLRYCNLPPPLLLGTYDVRSTNLDHATIMLSVLKRTGTPDFEYYAMSATVYLLYDLLSAVCLLRYILAAECSHTVKRGVSV